MHGATAAGVSWQLAAPFASAESHIDENNNVTSEGSNVGVDTGNVIGQVINGILGAQRYDELMGFGLPRRDPEIRAVMADASPAAARTRRSKRGLKSGPKTIVAAITPAPARC